MSNHNWFAVITAPVLLSKELTDKQKLLIALISNLSNDRGYCFASNKYLSECLNCSERYIQENLSILEEKKILGRVVKLNNKKEVEYRAVMLSLDNITPTNHSSPPPEPQFTTPHEPQFTHNNKVLKTNIKTLITNPEPTVQGKQSELFLDDKPVSLYSFCVDVWLKKIHPGWTFGAVHGQKIKSIISKLKKVSKESGIDYDDEYIGNLFTKMMTSLPEFYKNKDLQVIDSKFNEIISEIKEGKNGKQSNYQSARNAFSQFA